MFAFYCTLILNSVTLNLVSRHSLKNSCCVSFQIVKNLVFLAKTLQILHGENVSKVENDQDERVGREGTVTQEEGPFTLKDLINNMNKSATLEASQTPKHTQKVTTELCGRLVIEVGDSYRSE